MTTPLALNGQVALITGGANGLGRRIAATLAGLGARIAVVDIQLPSPGEPEFEPDIALQADVADEAAVRGMVGRVHHELGRVDVLVNSAGVMYKNALEELDLEKWQRTLAVNLTGPMLCAKHVVPIMKGQRRGRIINISSMMAVTAAETYSAYCATKAGLLQCTKVWALELAPFKITVNAVCPGWVLTAMSQGFIERIAGIHGISFAEGLQKILGLVPQRRFLDTEEVGNLVAFLASDAAAGITGTGVIIDGGTTAGMPYGIHRRLEETLGSE
ncbi:MAG: SDR family oxidoreductase [Bradyrhizobiaceae bacterium]|nr:SDR family oxidoreductase [Bradyrhizobiaceae bacterium]